MYTSFFGLEEKPFSITPDPRFLYLSERHAEALALLQYGVMESDGFIQLTGEVGTGKTTVTRCLINRLPEDVEVAVILNPRVTVREFLLTICQEFGLQVKANAGDTKPLVDALNAYLLECHARARRVVLILDEAQNLERELLEQVRLLTNLETETQKLLQIILVGQPELRQTLARRDLRQLAQRITGRYHLGALTRAETQGYIQHRLEVAGATHDIFTSLGLWQVHRLSGGVPRLINVICDRALLGAYTAERHRVGARTVLQAAAEIRGQPSRIPLAAKAAVGAAIVFAAAGLGLRWYGSAQTPDSHARTEAAAGPAVELPARSSFVAAAPPPPAPPHLPDPGPNDTLEPQNAPATVPAAPALAELLEDAGAATGTDRAFSILFGLWGLELASDGSQPCQQAVRHGLRCAHQLGSWALLRAMNRPAILSLIDAAGTVHHTVITALEEDWVELELGDQNQRFTFEEVSPFWFGEYLVLWRPHPGADDLMLPGHRGAGVAWLRDALATLQGSVFTGVDPSFYDSALEQQVREFQRSYRLRVDGKAGVQTLIALNTALAVPGTPVLSDDS